MVALRVSSLLLLLSETFHVHQGSRVMLELFFLEYQHVLIVHWISILHRWVGLVSYDDITHAHCLGQLPIVYNSTHPQVTGALYRVC